MKKILYFLLLLLPMLGWAQSRYGVEGVPVCWRTPLGVDSSLNRYVIISTTGKPVQTIVYENAAGGVVNVSGGTMRYGYCDCIDYTVPDSSITWEMLTEPVKDSIRFAKRDTFITVPPSENYFQNSIENPARFYNNIYFSCKGRTDTSIVVFLAAPVFEEQKGVVYHIKNDSGLVAAFVINYNHLSNNKRFYLLQRGQTAQVRLLPDAANEGNYGWAVNVVWDSIFDSQIVNPKWLYVSKSTGNNATAQKGNPSKPWADPFTAADNAITGDEIFVSDGIWTYIPGGEINSDVVPGLLRDGLIYHFSPSTKIFTSRNEVQTTADTLGLFYTNETVSCKILGSLNVFAINISSYPTAGFYCGDESDIEIELDTLSGLDMTNNSNFDNPPEGLKYPSGKVKLSIKRVEAYSDYNFTFSSGVHFLNFDYFEGGIYVKDAGIVTANVATSEYMSLTATGTAILVCTALSCDEIYANPKGGELTINQTKGAIYYNCRSDTLIFGTTTLNLGKVFFSSLYSSQNSACRLLVNCNGTYWRAGGGQRVDSLVHTGDQEIIFTGIIDLESDKTISLQVQGVVNAANSKIFIFKDVLFLNPNLITESVKDFDSSGLGIVFINCWSTPDFDTLNIIIHGEPVLTY